VFRGWSLDTVVKEKKKVNKEKKEHGMKIRSVIIVATFALFGTALAQDAATNGVKKAAKDKPGYRLPASMLVSCPVMSRVKLTDEQVAEVKKLETETNGKIAAASKQCESSGKKRTTYYKKRKELLTALSAKVDALLTPAQEKKVEAGRTVIAAGNTKLSRIRRKHYKAMRAAKGDKDKLAELRKAYQTNIAPIKKEMGTELDSKVGTRPTPVRKRKSKGGGKGK
jgi:hypothetical protein